MPLRGPSTFGLSVGFKARNSQLISASLLTCLLLSLFHTSQANCKIYSANVSMCFEDTKYYVSAKYYYLFSSLVSYIGHICTHLPSFSIKFCQFLLVLSSLSFFKKHLLSRSFGSWQSTSSSREIIHCTQMVSSMFTAIPPSPA